MQLAESRIQYTLLLIAAMLVASLVLLAAQQRQEPGSGRPDVTYGTSLAAKAHGKPGWTGVGGDESR